jgi:hypothetical protein
MRMMIQYEREGVKWPNGLPITRAAPIKRESHGQNLAFKIAAILSTRSGVGCMGGLGGAAE